MSKKILIIIIGAGVLFLGFVGFGFYVVLNKIAMIGTPPKEATGVEEALEDAAKPSLGPLFVQDPFVVNLADPGGRRYLRVGVSLEIDDVKRTDELNRRLPQIRHAILMILSAKKLEDVQTVEGKMIMRDELIAGLNGLLREQIIKTVYFTEFVVQ